MANKEYQPPCCSDDDNTCMASESMMLQSLFNKTSARPFVRTRTKDFTFIDLFAGIGGIRLPFDELGGKCVFSSEWDKAAQTTYSANFGEIPYGDITQEDTKAKIPQQFNVLCAGFPCQAFSIAGKQLGFDDTRGTLFFDVAEIISRRQPEVVFLENVKNLCSHDGGRTFLVIKSRLEQLGYAVFHLS